MGGFLGWVATRSDTLRVGDEVQMGNDAGLSWWEKHEKGAKNEDTSLIVQKSVGSGGLRYDHTRQNTNNV